MTNFYQRRTIQWDNTQLFVQLSMKRSDRILPVFDLSPWKFPLTPLVGLKGSAGNEHLL
jgi:hypothetical protein